MEVIENTSIIVTLSQQSEYAVRCGYCNAVIKFKRDECVEHMINDDLFYTIHCPKCGNDTNVDLPEQHLVLYRDNLSEEDLTRAMRNPDIIVI